jgi:general secretion pathway protein J
MKRRARDGFTLLELLLSISILALITGAIMGGINLGRRTWETTRASEALDEVESAVRSVAALVGRSYLVANEQQPMASPQVPGQQQQQLVFQGGRDACRFVTLSQGGAQWGGLILTEIGGEPGREGPELAVWTRVYRPAEGFSPKRGDMKRTVVLANLASFELAFYGSQEQGRPAAWSPNWINPAALPDLVAIKIGANRLGRVIEAAATVAVRPQ